MEVKEAKKLRRQAEKDIYNILAVLMDKTDTDIRDLSLIKDVMVDTGLEEMVVYHCVKISLEI